MLEGERAGALVEECHHKLSRLDPEVCTGTWRTPDGGVHEGRLQGADPEDVGHRIVVRLGPLAGVRLGPFGGPWSEAAGPPATVGGLALAVVVAAPIVIFYAGRLALTARSLRKRGARGGGTVFLATRHEFSTVDGLFHARVRAPRRGVPPPSFATLPPAHLDQPRFGEVRAPDGQVLFFMKDWRGRRQEPELSVLSRDGIVQVVMRRLPPWRKPKYYEKAGVGPRYGLELGDGLRLGMIRQRLGSKAAHTVAFTVIDQDGRRLVDAAPGFRHWVVCAHPAASAKVLYAAIALLYSGYKLP